MDAKTVLLLDELDRPPVPGPRGLRGLKGIQGARGFEGTDGESGPKGDKGDKGDQGQDGISVERATAHSLPPEREPTAEFNKNTGLLTFGIPRGDKGAPGAPGASGTPRVSPRTGNLLFGGSGGGSGEHPNLATHDALGLATDTELSAHAATLHDAAIPTFIQDTDPALPSPAKYLWVDTNTDFLWYNDGQVG